MSKGTLGGRGFLSLAAAIASAAVFAAGPQGGVAAMKRAFEANLPEVLESAKLSFDGVPAGHDVYNCSIPFEWKGARYLFGRVEPHDKWASSVVMLFRETGKDAWTRVGEFGTLELEDPYVAWVRGELVVGGTRVTKVDGKVKTYCGAFYRDHGRGPLRLEHFTVGPDRMKDIRLVELRDGRIGVFSRPRGEEVRRKYGSEAVIGFTTVASLEELTAGAIENAKVIEGVFGKDEWGGCNQAYLRPDGTVLVAGHLCCAGEESSNGLRRQIYCNAAFTFDPVTHRASHIRVVATRRMYPASEPKVPHLDDCVFTSGFVFNADGTVDVYTGLCDAAEARVRLRTLPGGGAEWIRPAKGPSPDRNAAATATSSCSPFRIRASAGRRPRSGRRRARSSRAGATGRTARVNSSSRFPREPRRR